MAHETVWVSDLLADSQLTKSFTSSDVLEADSNMALETMKLDRQGIASDPDRYPKEIWANYRDEMMERQQEIFHAGGFNIVRSDMAGVLSTFNLGKTRLHPVKLFQHDRVTPVEGEYSVLAWGEQTDCFLPDESQGVRKKGLSPSASFWRLSPLAKDGDLALRKSTLPDVDLAMDPRIRHTVFLSDELVQALKAQNLSKHIRMKKCRLV